MRLLQRSVLMVLAVVGLAFPSAAQDDIDRLLTESVDDAEKLIGAYVSPVMKGLSLSLNQGWYNTAKAHKVAGVDLTITVNAMTIPEAERLFNPSSLNLTHIELDNSSPDFPDAPTMAGPENSPVFRLQDDPTNTFQGPPGLGLKENVPGGRLPVPMAHLAFGLPKGTDVKIRFSPELTFGDETTFKLFGIGVMHDIKQWIPGIKLLPFDLSGFVGYTKLELNSQLDDSPGNEDQIGVFSINATTIQGVISKKFSVVTFYGGLGYNIAKSNLALKGTYNIGSDDEPQLVKDPVDLSFAASGVRATAGMRLKLAVFTFHADYTLQKYNCLTVGFGISVR